MSNSFYIVYNINVSVHLNLWSIVLKFYFYLPFYAKSFPYFNMQNIVFNGWIMGIKIQEYLDVKMFPSHIYCNLLVIYHSVSYSCWDEAFQVSLETEVLMPKYLKETGPLLVWSLGINCTQAHKEEMNKPRHLLISVAMIVMLCHTLNSLSNGVASVIFPSSALMLNCLSRSVCRSMENLQNRHICNLLQSLYDPYIPQQTFSNP